MSIVSTIIRDPRYAYLLYIVLIFLGSALYIPLSPTPTELSQNFYNIVVGAQPGDVAIFYMELNTIWGQLRQKQLWSVFQYLYEKDVCVVMLNAERYYPRTMLYLRDVWNIPIDKEFYEMDDYGKKYVVLPTYIGTQSAAFLLSEDFHGATGGQDIYGLNTREMPGIKDVVDANDIYMVYGSHLGGDYTIAWGVKYNCHIIASGCSGGLTIAAQWYGAGLIHGMLIGAKGGMEFDGLLGVQGGPSQRAGAAYLFVGIAIEVLIVTFNLLNFYNRRRLM